MSEEHPQSSEFKLMFGLRCQKMKREMSLIGGKPLVLGTTPQKIVANKKYGGKHSDQTKLL